MITRILFSFILLITAAAALQAQTPDTDQFLSRYSTEAAQQETQPRILFTRDHEAFLVVKSDTFALTQKVLLSKGVELRDRVNNRIANANREALRGTGRQQMPLNVDGHPYRIAVSLAVSVDARRNGSMPTGLTDAELSELANAACAQTIKLFYEGFDAYISINGDERKVFGRSWWSVAIKAINAANVKGAQIKFGDTDDDYWVFDALVSLWESGNLSLETAKEIHETLEEGTGRK